MTCADCDAKDATIAELIKALARPRQVVTIFQPVRQDTVIPTVFDRCSCNPANGGSGVCGCIMGSTRVTC